jgi:hypothetical protein
MSFSATEQIDGVIPLKTFGILGVLGSNLDRDTILTEVSVVFLSSSRQIPRLDYDRFLSDPF